MAAGDDTVDLVRRFLRSEGWVREPFEVRFLAAGEYNENYLVTAGDRRLVFRINHGTQLGLDDQISYEFTVLGLVAPSGVTPRPHRLVERHGDFPNGALLMEYLPGRPLDYRNESDLAGVAACFARIHELPYDTSGGPLLVQSAPIDDIVAECRGLLARHENHPLPEHGRRIRRYMQRVEALAREATFGEDALCIVNTEVNSGNFIVGDRVRLVDWEKAVASYRYQDLGHFLVPTTTLWKSDYRFDRATRRRFLELYREAANARLSLDEIDAATDALERTILLRAFSWVYMAWAEYESGSRAITNRDTFETMKGYLERIDAFLEVE